VSRSQSHTCKRDLDTSHTATKALLVCGVVAGLLFTVTWLAEGATRADYDPLTHPISSLSMGESGWMQVVSFIITGLLVLAFSIGLRRVLRPSGWIWGPLLVGMVGIGLIGAGIFVTDPLNGYPPGTLRIPTERTTHGILHDLFGIPFFLGLPVTCFVFARLLSRLGERRWAVYSAGSGFAMLGLLFLTRLGLRQLPGFADIGELFGLLQRIIVTIGFAWLMLLATYMLKSRFGIDGLSWAPFLIGALAIGTVSWVLYAPCPTGECTTVHTVVSTDIEAPPELVASLYADYQRWPRLFPATIRGVRLAADDGQYKTIEVDHVTEGKVINIMVVVSPTEVRLEEFKRRFDARFINRFEAVGAGDALFHRRRRSAEGSGANAGSPGPTDCARPAEEIRARADAGRCREGPAKAASRGPSGGTWPEIGPCLKHIPASISCSPCGMPVSALHPHQKQ
jgi:uncharacterized protein DUF998